MDQLTTHALQFSAVSVLSLTVSHCSWFLPSIKQNTTFKFKRVDYFLTFSLLLSSVADLHSKILDMRPLLGIQIL